MTYPFLQTTSQFESYTPYGMMVLVHSAQTVSDVALHAVFTPFPGAQTVHGRHVLSELSEHPPE
jgi:hypothetical protein